MNEEPAAAILAGAAHIAATKAASDLFLIAYVSMFSP